MWSCQVYLIYTSTNDPLLFIETVLDDELEVLLDNLILQDSIESLSIQRVSGQVMFKILDSKYSATIQIKDESIVSGYVLPVYVSGKCYNTKESCILSPNQLFETRTSTNY